MEHPEQGTSREAQAVAKELRMRRRFQAGHCSDGDGPQRSNRNSLRTGVELTIQTDGRATSSILGETNQRAFFQPLLMIGCHDSNS